MHPSAWRKRCDECRREMRVTVGATLTVKGSARRLPAGPAGPDPRPKATSDARLAAYGPVVDGAACGTPIWWSELLCGAASPARGSRYSL